ncbi:MAG: hypothetical protein IJT72_02590 [Lachnospiraceae bacterium]|nr:hypothetical protein [Lachnospiraceae bacterium]
MYELTIGDQRYIEESLTTWMMYINPIVSSMDSVPKELKDKISELSDRYVDEFYDFYEKKKDEDESLHADEIKNAFDEIWEKEHEEFFDMDKLFKKCSKKELKKAESAIKDAKEAFSYQE